MVTVLTHKHLYYDENKKDVSLVFISVASSSELPATSAIPDTDLVMHEGSGAWDISTGESYGWVNNAWVKQPNGIPFNFYEEV